MSFPIPVASNSGLEAEIESLKHVLLVRANYPSFQKKMTVCTDSKQMEEEFKHFVFLNDKKYKDGKDAR